VSSMRNGQPPGHVTQTRVRAWVEASCAAQGVPVKVADGPALAAVVALLAPGRTGAARKRSEDGEGTTGDTSATPA
jgi:hypothetical protein